MQLQSLQQRLQTIYDIRTDHDVEDFVFSDALLAEQLDTSVRARQLPEKLLVCEHSDGLDVSLYLDQSMLANLRSDSPAENLHAGNLATFCTVTEGVSHFVYLVWNASHARSISLFELELQAEVDKYVMAAALLADQRKGSLPHNLPHVLFDQAQFDTRLDYQEQQRYRMANAYARHYCHNLHRNLLELGDSVLITRELRRFYRLIHQRKIQRITTLPRVHLH